MTERRPPATEDELVRAFADVFNELAPETPEDIQAALRAAGASRRLPRSCSASQRTWPKPNIRVTRGNKPERRLSAVPPVIASYVPWALSPHPCGDILFFLSDSLGIDGCGR